MVSSKGTIAIVGSGPAGMLAAIAAAEAGARVTLCEQLRTPGVKLLATGGGHCNLTNTADAGAVMAAFGRQACPERSRRGRFLAPALARMDGPKLRAFFASLGVPTHAPDGFHVFPVSNSAQDVQAALVRRLAALGVTLAVETAVEALILHHGRLAGLRTHRGPLQADRVVLASGGKGYPQLGAAGTGYALAERAGHTLVPPVPGLVPLVTAERWVEELAGVTMPDVEVWMDPPRRRSAGTRGALLFTHRGLSGPAVLDLSADVASLLRRQPDVPVRVNLTPATPPAAWAARLDDWQRQHGRRLVKTLLADHLPRSLAAALCRLAGGVGDVRAAEAPSAHRRRLIELLTRLPLTVTATEGFEQAMVTRGGVALREVDPRTLQSRKLAGLFFAGEVLDLDGPCGGYNLQWAFASGALAGHSAARSLTHPHPASGGTDEPD